MACPFVSFHVHVELVSCHYFIQFVRLGGRSFGISVIRLFLDTLMLFCIFRPSTCFVLLRSVPLFVFFSSVLFLSVFLDFCLFLVSVCLSLFVIVCPSVRVAGWLAGWLAGCLAACLSFCISAFLFFGFSAFLLFCLAVSLSFCRSVSLSVSVSLRCLSVSLFVYLPACLPAFACLFACPSVRLSEFLFSLLPLLTLFLCLLAPLLVSLWLLCCCLSVVFSRVCVVLRLVVCCVVCGRWWL